MNIPNIGGLLTIGKSFVMANRPEILYGASVVSTLAAVVSAARAGYKSGQQVLEEEMKQVASPEPPFDTFLDYYTEYKEQGPHMDRKEIAKLTWLNYLPTAGITLAALGSTTGLHLVHVQEKKMLAAACIMAIDEVKKEAGEYEKSLKSLGFTTSDDPEALEAAADSDGVAKFVTGDGLVEEKYLVRDAKTQRDRWSNKLEVENAVNEVNNLLATEGECSLDTFYTYAGFNNIPEGCSLGWKGGTKLNVRWDTEIRDDDRIVRQFTFRPAPKEGYQPGS